MELSWGALLLLCATGAAAWFWQDSLAARERASTAALEACERLGLQFLDGAAAFASLSLTRDFGWLTFRRTYVFDYTANSIERRQGFVVMTGRRVETVGFAAEAQSGAQSSGASSAQAAPAPRILQVPERRPAGPSANVEGASAEQTDEQRRDS